MGKIKLLTQEQSLIVQRVIHDEFLQSHFYFTGGTALSSVYLQHRESEDLDFFSEQSFIPEIIFDKVTAWSEEDKFDVELRTMENINVFQLTFPHHVPLKVDFVYYRHKRIEKGQVIDGLQIDSMFDIAINKLLTTNQRTQVKDFVDLYFLLQTHSLWDLIEGVRTKFKVKLDPYIIASDFFKVESFTSLPRMLKSLTLEELQSFFRETAKELARRSVE
jgi:predicted nucleotidyltransferase component of viral defense system